jgi:hypothetical protein
MDEIDGDDTEELDSIAEEDTSDDDGVAEDDAEKLISIDEEDTPDDDGVTEGLKERDSEADSDAEDDDVSAVEDTRLSEETLAADEVASLEVVEDGVAAPSEDEIIIDELVLSADELSVELAVDEMSIVVDAEDD